jgi:putative DNA primase/helicase
MTAEVFDWENEKHKVSKRRVVSSEEEVTEDSVALAFSHRFGESLKYDHHAGSWYQWDGARWKRNETKLAFHFCRQVCRQMANNAKGMLTAKAAGAVERLCQNDPMHAVTNSTWDADPLLLGTPDGTVDLKTGRLSTSNPAQHITRLTSCSPIDKPPERWLAFLDDATRGDKEMQTYLQRIAGYCLTGLTTEHSLFFIYGPGGNGKSVFLNVLVHILNEYAAPAPMDTFTKSKFNGHPTELAMLKGPRLVTASETEEGKAWAESRIKSLTGGDAITARFMRQDFFTFTPQFKLLFAGNFQPSVSSNDPAMRRRVNMLPFVNRPTKPDKDLEAKLLEEAPQILNWMIQGCLDWQSDGLARPKSVVEATKEYFMENDVLGRWLHENCSKSETAWELPTPVFKSWSEFARDNGEEVGTSVSLAARLKKIGISKGKVAGQAAYMGFSLNRKTI